MKSTFITTIERYIPIDYVFWADEMSVANKYIFVSLKFLRSVRFLAPFLIVCTKS